MAASSFRASLELVRVLVQMTGAPSS